MKSKNFLGVHSVFIIFALMLHAFCAALAVGGMMRVYSMMLAYEHSRPEYVARNVLSLFEDKRYADIIKLGKVPLSKMETAESFGRAAEKNYSGGQFSLSRSGDSNWQIACDGRPVATLSLRNQKSGGRHGMDLWTTQRLDVLSPAPQSYTVQAPPAVRIAVNDIVPGNSALVTQALIQSPFGKLPDSLAPAVAKVYQFDGLFLPPDVTATADNGTTCAVAQFQNSITVCLSPSEQVIAQLSQFGEQAACAYAKFITNDAKLDEVLPFFLPESEYYTHLKQFYNGWYNEHDQYAFKNARFSNWFMYDERHISCDISFDYWIKMKRHEYTYPSKYTMYFVLSDKGWRVANLVVL
ncbi:MAG TPA: hypothetical protein VN626_01775 [Clostridia bacterium]|nr:hypothetical protein [Clostridia bacterium]